MCCRYCGLVHALGPGPDTGAFSALVELGASLAGRKVFTIFLQVVPDFEKTTLQAGEDLPEVEDGLNLGIYCLM